MRDPRSGAQTGKPRPTGSLTFGRPLRRRSLRRLAAQRAARLVAVALPASALLACVLPAGAGASSVTVSVTHVTFPGPGIYRWPREGEAEPSGAIFEFRIEAASAPGGDGATGEGHTAPGGEGASIYYELEHPEHPPAKLTVIIGRPGARGAVNTIAEGGPPGGGNGRDGGGGGGGYAAVCEGEQFPPSFSSCYFVLGGGGGGGGAASVSGQPAGAGAGGFFDFADALNGLEGFPVEAQAAGGKGGEARSGGAGGRGSSRAGESGGEGQGRSGNTAGQGGGGGAAVSGAGGGGGGGGCEGGGGGGGGGYNGDDYGGGGGGAGGSSCRLELGEPTDSLPSLAPYPASASEASTGSVSFTIEAFPLGLAAGSLTSTSSPGLALGSSSFVSSAGAAQAASGGGGVMVPLSCQGPAGSSCQMTVALSTVETLEKGKVVALAATAPARARAARRARTSRRSIAVGRATVTLLPAETQSVAVMLDARGRALLRKRHSLPVSVQVSAALASGRSVAVSTQKVSLRAR